MSARHGTDRMLSIHFAANGCCRLAQSRLSIFVYGGVRTVVVDIAVYVCVYQLFSYTCRYLFSLAMLRWGEQSTGLFAQSPVLHTQTHMWNIFIEWRRLFQSEYKRCVGRFRYTETAQRKVYIIWIFISYYLFVCVCVCLCMRACFPMSKRMILTDAIICVLYAFLMELLLRLASSPSNIKQYRIFICRSDCVCANIIHKESSTSIGLLLFVYMLIAVFSATYPPALQRLFTYFSSPLIPYVVCSTTKYGMCLMC